MQAKGVRGRDPQLDLFSADHQRDAIRERLNRCVVGMNTRATDKGPPRYPCDPFGKFHIMLPTSPIL
jgi:hypothetical protein